VFRRKKEKDTAIPYKGLVKRITSLHIITIQFLKAWTAQSVIEFTHFDSLDGAEGNWVEAF
jgi:hypothetical protein